MRSSPDEEAPARSALAKSLFGRVFALLATSVGVFAEPSFYTARVAPIMDRHCVTCHGAEKNEAELRLDSFEQTLRGSDAGPVVAAGDLEKSELFRRITLPHDHEEFMPAEGKPPLSSDEIKILRLWIERGASATAPLSAFPEAPAPKPRKPAIVPLAPDWRPHAAQVQALQRELGIKLVPRSHIPTDGLIIRTASAPAKCDDAALAKLAPIAALIVEAELARTAVTDQGLAALARCENLRAIDLTRTAVTSAGLPALAGLAKLEALNLTETVVDDAGAATLRQWPALKRVWLYGSKVSDGAGAARVVGN